MATVSELISDLKEIVDESTTGSYPTDAELMAWMTEAGNVIAEETLYFKSYITSAMVVATSTVIALPSDWLQGIAIQWPTSTHVDPISESELIEAGYDLTTTGTPSYWYIMDEAINFYPVPASNATVKIWYHNFPAALATSGDTPAIPTQYQRLLITYAAYRFWLKEEEPNSAGVFFSEFMQGIARMKMTVLKQQGKKRYRVRDVRGYA